MQTLTGEWMLAVDPDNRGRDEGWFTALRPEAQPAPVPGIIQQVFPAYHGVAWYWHTFQLRESPAPDQRLRLRFGAVDYRGDVWLNGVYLGYEEGGETPFEFDVTAEVKPTGNNLLAVRVLNPTQQPIDGYVLAETPHRNKAIPHRPGASFNCGGIMYPVELRRVPVAHVADLCARPDPTTGLINATVWVRHGGGEPASATLTLTVSPAVEGDVLNTVRRDVRIPPGISEHSLSLSVAEPRWWNLDEPYLYQLNATLTTEDGGSHQHRVRCGFRDFRIVDGYFYLNGKRIFLKSTHTGNNMPIGQQVVVASDHVRRDLLFAKAAGFNTVRFIAGIGYPQQLDFCDEIGLMVWESSFAGWLLADSPHMAERFRRNNEAMIRRDRNHPSLTIWELLNETPDGPVFREALAFLPRLRELDPTRLALLSSGRWDGDWSIGSASNPNSLTWEHVWGVEAPDASRVEGVGDDPLTQWGYAEKAGDAHYYPKVPQTAEASQVIRDMGHVDKPVLLSEYGVGSLMNVTREAQHFQQAGARPDLEDFAALQAQSDALAADWRRLGFDGVYAFPEDLLRESQRLHARHRRLGFDLVRANPQLCGFNLTGMLDHALTGEGLWTYWREWKPATFDAVTDGWSPLRWCLAIDPQHGYAGRTMTVEAILANEGILPPGEYEACCRILGPAGIAWEKKVTFGIPSNAPLAVPVMRETIVVPGPQGQYTVAAHLARGGAPSGGRLCFHVSDPAALPSLRGDALVWGLGDEAMTWLASRGLVCQPLMATVEGDLILVGKPAGPGERPTEWEDLARRIQLGAAVVFLSSEPFRDSPAAMTWLSPRSPGRCYPFNDWLYHKECVANRHPVLAGLQAPGIMEWDYYGPVIPRDVFEGLPTPDETVAAAFATGYHQAPNGYHCSLLIGAYRYGAGWLMLNTAPVLDNLTCHPAADRLLLNLIQHAQSLKAR